MEYQRYAGGVQLAIIQHYLDFLLRKFLSSKVLNGMLKSHY